MKACVYCGREINFRYINGVRTPLHRCDSEFRPASGYRKPFTHEKIVNCHARCKYCDDAVIFYQSPYGGRVYFNPPLGPPWDKHKLSCPHYPFPQTTSKSQLRHLDSGLKPQPQGTDWKPLELRRRVEVEGNSVTKIFGKIAEKDKELVLSIMGEYPLLDVHPIFIKTIDESRGQYRISTFFLNERTLQIRPIELPASVLSKESKTKKRDAGHTLTTLTKKLDDKRKKLKPLQRDASDALHLAGMPKDKAIEFVSNIHDDRLVGIKNKAEMLKAGKDIIDKLEILKMLSPDEKKSWSNTALDKSQDVRSKIHAQSLAIRHILRVKDYTEPFMSDSTVKAASGYLDQALKKQVDFDIEELAKICGAVKSTGKNLASFFPEWSDNDY